MTFGVNMYYAIIQKCVDLDQNFKVTVMVETPDGPISGNTVRNIQNRACAPKRVNWPGGNPADVIGEAVVVDMGERGVLFALIGDSAEDEFYQIFYPQVGGASTYHGIKDYYNLPNGTKGSIDPQIFPGYPRLVTFKDMDDPKSVTLLQEWERAHTGGGYFLVNDRMEEVFGEGVMIKDVVLEITDEPVTWKMEEYLGPLHAVGPYEFVNGENK